MAAKVDYPTRRTVRVQYIRYASRCCICLQKHNLVDISDSYRIRDVLSNDLEQYIMINSIDYLCRQCCMMLQMCCSMEEWDRGLDLFDVYYRTQCASMPEEYASSGGRRKRRRRREYSKFEAVKRRLFEDEETKVRTNWKSCDCDSEDQIEVSVIEGDTSQVCKSQENVIVDGLVELPSAGAELPDYYEE